VQWRVKPGDAVHRGDIIAEVETEKGVVDVEVFESGTVDELLVREGTKVPVGEALARIRGPSEEQPAPGGERLRASPAARKFAAEHAVELLRVKGSGADGVITLADVENAARAAPAAKPTAAPAPPAAPAAPVAPATAPAATQEQRQAAMRRGIAAAVSRAHREIPHYYLSADVDLSRALDWLRKRNEARPVPERVLPATLLLKAAALALREVPELNGFWRDDALIPSAAIHLGVAIALRGGGLMAPAVHDADRLSIDELDRALRDLVERSRRGGLRGTELTDATVTVTNLGELGAHAVYGIIYPPQVALVGFGRVTERAWAAGGAVTARPVVTTTLAADHRSSDGHRGSRYLAAVDRLLQAPETL
jgi:pyruvate dehydrogenase E2 component (dihydrolipoamide acetyltransferase)